jgi:hypothetical protein
MDVFGVTAGILSIANVGSSIAQKLQSTLNYPKIAAEVHLYTLILRETSEIVLQNAEVPASATTALRQCQERLEDLHHAVSARKSKLSSIQLAVLDFRRSAVLLRDIIME